MAVFLVDARITFCDRSKLSKQMVCHAPFSLSNDGKLSSKTSAINIDYSVAFRTSSIQATYYL